MQWYVRLSQCRSWGVEWKPVRVGASRIGVRLNGRGYATRDVNHHEGTELDWETVEVRCGGSGSITVDLLDSLLLSQPSTPLILYLPPTGAHLSHQHPQLPSILLNPPIPSTIARINYRWNIPSSSLRTPHYKTPLFDSKKHPFPIPVHDVLTAYEWLTTVYLPQYSSSSPQSSPSSDGRSAASRAASISARRSVTSSPSKSLYAQSTSPSRKIIQRPLLIYGDFLGGTLATSLALTESFSSKQTPTRIAGLIAKNGVFDWLDIASFIQPSSQAAATESTKLASDSAPLSPPPSPSALEHSTDTIQVPSIEIRQDRKVWDQSHLYFLRQTLFTTPSQAFDPFASPTQFFHTAGIAVPSSFPTASPPPSPSPDDVFSTLLPGTQGEFFTDIDIEHEAKEEAHAGKRVSELNLGGAVPRQAHLKFPSSGSGLVIPRSLFLYNSTITPDPTPLKKGAKKTKKKVRDEEDITPASQAEDMAALMRRSVLRHEFKDNGHAQWDEDLDPAEAAEKRVQVLALIDGENESSKKEEDLVREWIEDSLG